MSQTVNVDSLNAVQDEVFADKTLWPREVDHDAVTYCNLAALRVARGVGCRALDAPGGDPPLTADKMYNLIKFSTLFHKTPMEDCQRIVNSGALIVAILPSWSLRQHSGHVCTLTSGIGDHSGRWERFTPFCMNLGRVGTCFRQKGINWAFQMIPEFFQWMSP
jgi:hypothetical protein